MFNVNGKYKIDRHKFIKAAFLGSVMSISVVLGAKTLTYSNDYESKYNEFSHNYLEILDDLDYSEFDNQFESICKNGKYHIDNKIYDIKELYVITTSDNINHIVDANKNNIDILTGETIDKDIINIVCLKNSSLFYHLYKDGIIVNEDINVDKVILKQYADSWDGQMHNMTPELYASNKANEYIATR